jgi:formylglycine-generating enzyme required for sulfatase activity
LPDEVLLVRDLRFMLFRAGLKKSTALARVFGPLLTPGGTVQRDVFLARFRDLVEELQSEGSFIRSGQVVAGGDEIDLGHKQKLILVPIKAKGKSFLMGSPDVDHTADWDERLQDEVDFTHDWDLGKFKVTVGQFKAFVADNPDFKTEAEKAGAEYTWRNPGFEQNDDHPVVRVSWNDALAFCAWLSKKTGRKFRLPFEAEWEYSCRAGSTTRYHFGDDEDKLDQFAWYDKNAGKGTKPVGLKKPNPFELHDMYGNASEWCQDGKREYKKEKVTDPEGPSDGADRLAGARRVVRGGTWFSPAWDLRSAAPRFDHWPSDRFDCIGFRVVCLR